MKTLKQLLAKFSGCEEQHTGWSCNTCFHNMELPLKENIHQYWLAVLFFRGDYLDCDWEDVGDNDMQISEFPKLLLELYNVLNKEDK